jgi:predicted metalloprotease with PDZ domain
VSQVRRGTPAHQAGLNVDDEILAIDDFRVRVDGLDRRLEQYAPGRDVTLLVARRDELMRIPVRLGREPSDAWRLEARPDASPEQQARRKAWSGEAATSSGTP